MGKKGKKKRHVHRPRVEPLRDVQNKPIAHAPTIRVRGKHRHESHSLHTKKHTQMRVSKGDKIRSEINQYVRMCLCVLKGCAQGCG